MKIGKTKWYIDHVFSTNDFLKKRLAEGLATDEEVVFADFQTAGKGQRDKSWSSEKGLNILCSFSLIYPPNQTPNLPQLSEEISLRVLEFVKGFGIDEISIKWPNDILVNEKKIAGILIENQWSSGELKYSIIGLGINLNQQHWEDEKFTRKPTSIYLETQVLQSLSEARNDLESKFENLSIRPDVTSEYLHHLYGFGEKIEIEEIASGKILSGQIIDIDGEGRIAFQVDSQIKTFSNGEIKFL